MTAVTVGDETRQGSRAVAKYVRSSAFKAREVLDLVRGKSYNEARDILVLSERRISDTIAKCLDSAVANAEHNDDLDGDELFIAACYADEGPTLKRWRPRARGRATPIRKRTCHITVIVARYTDDELTAMDARMALKGTARRSSAAEARRRRVAASRQRDSEQTEDHDAEDDAEAAADDTSTDAAEADTNAAADDVETEADPETDTEADTAAGDVETEADHADTSTAENEADTAAEAANDPETKPDDKNDEKEA